MRKNQAKNKKPPSTWKMGVNAAAQRNQDDKNAPTVDLSELEKRNQFTNVSSN